MCVLATRVVITAHGHFEPQGSHQYILVTIYRGTLSRDGVTDSGAGAAAYLRQPAERHAGVPSGSCPLAVMRRRRLHLVEDHDRQPPAPPRPAAPPRAPTTDIWLTTNSCKLMFLLAIK
ncbi:hypothetical protein EVAR_31208_1 [Eumeta japonica]|uniref:Uncharacterized protein n=1 Tax=Eumeta variegata TaxID=151549 RepID=A0A4C1VZG9_EUMVA|nr:hypothetical protein EVAR_31208_1 [Eumeta japonica]